MLAADMHRTVPCVGKDHAQTVFDHALLGDELAPLSNRLRDQLLIARRRILIRWGA